MQMHSSIASLPSGRTRGSVTPRFTGLLIAGVLLALVGASILVSITFQNVFVPTPSLVRGGNVYTIPQVNTVAPWQSNPAGMPVQIIHHR